MIKYFKATWLPTTLCVLFFALAICTFGTWFGFLFSLAGILSLIDSQGRCKDYERALYLLSCTKTIKQAGEAGTPKLLNKYARAILRRHRVSRCQRNAACCAAKDAGFGSQGREYYYKEGYRWYHLLPEDTFTSRCPYFTIKFYRNLSGV